MATTDNILQTVQTYQRSLLARLQNLNCFIASANTRFKDFENFKGNLGDTVTYDTPPQMISNDGLVVTTFSTVEQLKRSITVNKSRNVNFAFNAQQLIFNIDNTGYRDEFEKSAIKELGSYIEQDVASVIPSNTYRFYNPGVTGTGPYKVSPVSSFTTLSDIRSVFDEYGADPIDYKMYLPNRAIPQIIGSGLNQFALDRNNRIAMSWEVGEFQDMMTYRSNLLPLHVSGTTGNSQQVLTVVSVTRQADGGITSIVFSGATISDANAVKAYDVFQFNPTAAGLQVNFLSYSGHANINLPLQFEATADAAGVAVTGNVTISVSPVIYDVTAVTGNPLIANKQNTNFDFSAGAISAGITALGLPSHRCGLLTSGNPLYIAMPKLPDMDPFKTASESDPDTGVSLRLYTGAGFGTNTYGSILDCLWGKDLEPTHSMRIPFPV